ncbi:MAG: DUF2267 domain-containing protein [Caldilineaceae bacterium]
MQYQALIDQVKQRAELGNPEDAERLTRTVLGVLGERLYRTVCDSLSSQLPKEMKGFLFSSQPPENTWRDVQQFSLEEFYNRVSARMNSGYPTAVRQSQTVMGVLQETVSPGVIDNVRAELPDEFAELFHR